MADCVEINGLHLLVDGQVEDIRVFRKENLDQLIRQLVTDLDMQIILGPHFKDVELDPSKISSDGFHDDGGTSGFCMISTSHISIHAWPLRKMFMMDIFSCQTFDAYRAQITVKEFLHPTTLKVKSISRCP